MDGVDVPDTPVGCVVTEVQAQKGALSPEWSCLPVAIFVAGTVHLYISLAMVIFLGFSFILS